MNSQPTPPTSDAIAYDRAFIAEILRELFYDDGYGMKANSQFTVESIKEQMDALIAADNADAAGVQTAREIAAQPGEGVVRNYPVAWHTDDFASDKSATTYDPAVAEMWRRKGWPVTPLFAGPADSPPRVADALDGERYRGMRDEGSWSVEIWPGLGTRLSCTFGGFEFDRIGPDAHDFDAAIDAAIAARAEAGGGS